MGTNSSQGKLFVVATPIGNLGDFSSRAIETLKSVDLVLAEDTRSYRKLSERFNITTPCKSFFEHNEARSVPSLIEQLEKGAVIALISESGTPTISDPGFRLVTACAQAGISIVPVPGPNACIAALSISGFPTDCFLFAGFLSRKKGRRKQELEQALAADHTTIFYESPHRILSTLQTLASLDGTRLICLARELTKQHEEILRGTAANIASQVENRKGLKGEIVLLISGDGFIFRRPHDNTRRR